MKKIIVAMIICAVLAAAAFTAVFADTHPDLNIVDSSDSIVYAPGVFDIVVSSQPGVTYQWCARVGYDGSWLPLEDTERYKGTKTNHFQFITADGFANEDWASLRWCCLVTWPDGYQAYSNSQSMIIYTYADLLRHLDQDGVKITDFRLSSRVFFSAVCM